jgi:uncharacterized membrane protein
MLQRLTLKKTFPSILLIGGVLGLIASFVLSYDTFKVSQNGHYIPSCNLNPVLSCGTVISTAGDTIFGLPYPYYGIAAFAVLVTIGSAMLAGARFKRWYWITFQSAFTLGTIGAYLLLLRSLFKIHALCPYCLSVDVVTTTLFWYVTLYNIDQKHIRLPKGKAQQSYNWVRRHHLDLLILWFVIVTGLILKHFWYYYRNHLF